jgi:hypothetical protein
MPIADAKAEALPGNIETFCLFGNPVAQRLSNPIKTRLLRDAEAAGCGIRCGVGMFVDQGAEQTRLWTGMEPPKARMRQAVLERLRKHGGD